MPPPTRRLALASRVLPEFAPEVIVEAAARAGWDAVGVWVDLREWTAATTRRVRACLAASGLAPVDVEVVRLKPGPLDPRHLQLLEIGAELGAPNVLVVSSDPDAGATTAKYAALCERGRVLGLRVALEFGLFTEVRTLDAALAIVLATRDPAAALLVDSLHLVRSGGTPADAARVPRQLYAYAQLCDAPARGPGADDPAGILAEALDGRLQCGEGGLPLAELLQALPRDLPLSIEMRSRALRDAWPEPVERARVTLEATRRFLARTA
ncbi:MAG: sugar phosphate isomerase/epimerase family protein [Pseudomonadota bacterium]|jgi:sugar phosphate isomerase/epimerase